VAVAELATDIVPDTGLLTTPKLLFITIKEVRKLDYITLLKATGAAITVIFTAVTASQREKKLNHEPEPRAR